MATNDDEPMPLPADEASLSVGDAAKVLDVDPDTVREWVRKGKLRADKKTPGGHLRFKLETIEQLQIAMRRAADRPTGT